ncbi:MAG: beta-glucosidase BglX [Rhodothermales bacterium]|nr:beta-glucosidase BglX [Rhodothermales bacterium]
MYIRYRFLLLVLAGVLPLQAHAQPTAYRDAREDAFVDSLLARMTVEEKLGQLTQYTGRWSVTGPTVPQGGEEELRAGRIGSFLNIIGAEPTHRIQRMAVEESRLGIPLLFGHDVIHGFRTIFPVPLAETATWNPEAVEHAARIAAREASASGVHWTFAPMVDIARDARWSRIVEGSGEDPYLGSVMAAARVRGFQGDDLAADTTLLATAKHFAAYGGAEAGRDYNVVDISERTLREVYLPPFKAAIDAGVQTLMSAFNEIGGVPATGSRHLMTDILRGEWGFDGFVVADYTAVWELMHHGVAADSAEAGRRALAAGVDMSMVDGIYIRNLPPLVASGALPMGVVDEAVRRVLRAKYRAGLFEDPYRYGSPEREAATHLAPAHRAFAREVARQAIVLLKNDGTLPLSKDLGRLAVIGALAADSLSALGSWAAAGRWEDAVPILAGIRAALPEADVRYAPGYPAPPRGGFHQIVEAMLSEDTSGHDAAVRLAAEADAVVLVLGEHRELTGEAASRARIDLPGAQLELARRVIAAAGEKPVVVLITSGRPLALGALDAVAPAILDVWHLGVEMGPAVADVLFGDANPSGKLPVTFPYVTGQEPLYYNRRQTGRPHDVPGANDKYVSRYIDVPVEPLYPFGHGLSYTTFGYENLRLSAREIGMDGALTVRVDVANTGGRAGAEVVQLYVRDEVGSVTRPLQELKGFERIELAPGETRTVAFRLRPEDLRFWGPGDAWTVEPGFFTVMVGGSSAETLTTRFELTDE